MLLQSFLRDSIAVVGSGMGTEEMWIAFGQALINAQGFIDEPTSLRQIAGIGSTRDAAGKLPVTVRIEFANENPVESAKAIGRHGEEWM